MKSNKALYIIVAFLCLIVLLCTIIKVTYKEDSNDAIRFKNEYESYNDEYLNLSINKSNPIKYSNYEEVFKILESENGIIYIGSPDSNWCRSAIPALFDVLKDNKIETLYYLNIKSDMDYYTVEDSELTYALDDNGNEMKGTENYFKLLSALDNYLPDYTIQLEDTTYELGEKRIYFPTVLFIKDGNIVGVHTSTVASQSDSSIKLTDEEYNELYNIYEDYIIDMNSETCSTDKIDGGC